MGFIHAELDAGLTFAQVAITERAVGNTGRAERNIGLARQACGEAQRRIDTCERADAPEAFDAAKEKLNALIAAIHAFRGAGGPRPLNRDTVLP